MDLPIVIDAINRHYARTVVSHRDQPASRRATPAQNRLGPHRRPASVSLIHRVRDTVRNEPIFRCSADGYRCSTGQRAVITLPTALMAYFLYETGTGTLGEDDGHEWEHSRDLPGNTLPMLLALLRHYPHNRRETLLQMLPHIDDQQIQRGYHASAILTGLERGYNYAAGLHPREWNRISSSDLIRAWALVIRGGQLIRGLRPVPPRGMRRAYPEWFIRWQKLRWQLEEVISSRIFRVPPAMVIRNTMATVTAGMVINYHADRPRLLTRPPTRPSTSRQDQGRREVRQRRWARN